MAQENGELRPDICVIGAGPGGIAAAAAAASREASVVLVEKRRMDGNGLHHGSIPAQALSAAAKRAQALRTAAHFGVKAPRFDVDFGAVNARMRDVIGRVAPNSARERITGLGVRIIEGAARFTDPDTVAVGDTTIKAKRFVIATGSSPLLPDIPGLAVTPYFTDETIFDLTEIPRHLVVVGATSVGLELAQVFCRLGSAVTVLGAEAPLQGSDPEAVAIVLDALAREGVKVRAGLRIGKVARSLAKIRILLATEGGEETIEGSHLLIAAGHGPNVEGLDLHAAGIRAAPRGLVLDKALRTTNKRVYAVGDAAGGPNYAHVADYHASLVVRHALLREPAKIKHQIIPSVTYTDPELAQIGLLEPEASAHAGGIRVLRWPYRENDRAQVEQATVGHIKVVTDRAGEILGVTIVGPHAGEAISAWTLAMSQKLNIRAFASLIVPYPSYAEVGKRAAMAYFTSGLTTPATRRIMGWLRRRR